MLKENNQSKSVEPLISGEENLEELPSDELLTQLTNVSPKHESYLTANSARDIYIEYNLSKRWDEIKESLIKELHKRHNLIEYIGQRRKDASEPTDQDDRARLRSLIREEQEREPSDPKSADAIYDKSKVTFRENLPSYIAPDKVDDTVKRTFEYEDSLHAHMNRMRQQAVLVLENELHDLSYRASEESARLFTVVVFSFVCDDNGATIDDINDLKDTKGKFKDNEIKTVASNLSHAFQTKHGPLYEVVRHLKDSDQIEKTRHKLNLLYMVFGKEIFHPEMLMETDVNNLDRDAMPKGATSGHRSISQEMYRLEDGSEVSTIVKAGDEIKKRTELSNAQLLHKYGFPVPRYFTEEKSNAVRIEDVTLNGKLRLTMDDPERFRDIKKLFSIFSNNDELITTFENFKSVCLELGVDLENPADRRVIGVISGEDYHGKLYFIDLDHITLKEKGRMRKY